MPEVEKLDAVVIGTGQGGKPLAGALAEAGWNAAVVEKGLAGDKVGGTCVVAGCTPTKTMVASARVAYLAGRAGEYGVEVGHVSVDMERVRERKRQIVEEWSSGSKKGMERHETLELIMGTARFEGPRRVAVDLNDGGIRLLEAEKIFINAGARPRVPDLEGLDSVPYLDSTSIMELGEVPEHLVILGGGFIGLEFGQMFRRFGAEVTVVDRNSRIAHREDEDVSRALQEIFEEDGVRVVTDAEARSVAEDEDGRIVARVARDGSEEEVVGSHLLVAAGRTPNSDLLNPGAAGLSTDDRGYIPVNHRCETDVDGIWALGDITGAPPFTHTSYDDFRVIRTNVLEGGSASKAGRLLPYVVFTDPQLGRVGLSEEQAREEGSSVKVARLPMSRVARAMEVNETRGFMKAVVDAETDRILGAAVLGLEGGEVVSVLQTAIMGDLPYTALRDAMIAHPTLAESLNNLFMAMEG